MPYVAHRSPQRHPHLVVTTTSARLLKVVAVVVDAGQSTVQLQGEVDVVTGEQVAAALDEELARGRRSVRLDLSRVTFLDCAGLRVLVTAHNRFLAAPGVLVLTGLNRQLTRLLEITHLDEALLVADPPIAPPRGRHLHSVPTGPTA